MTTDVIDTDSSFGADAQSSRAATTATKPTAKVSLAKASPLGGTLWFAGWLFTIGFAKLGWWKAILALIVWPYFLGLDVR